MAMYDSVGLSEDSFKGEALPNLFIGFNSDGAHILPAGIDNSTVKCTAPRCENEDVYEQSR